MTSLRTEAPPPLVIGGPEAALRVDCLEQTAERTTGRMELGPWACDPDGRVLHGMLGVLADDVIGYALVAAAPVGRWSVSAEIGLDLCAPVPAQGYVFAEGETIHSTGDGGLSEGSIISAAGDLVLRARQRGSFVDRVPNPAILDAAHRDGSTHVEVRSKPSEAANAWEALGAKVRLRRDRSEVTVPTGPAVVNPIGSIHGGVSIAVTEIAANAAMFTAPAALEPASIHVVYVRPFLKGTVAHYRAQLTHRGRRQGAVQVDGYDAAGRMCTTGVVTYRAPLSVSV